MTPNYVGVTVRDEHWSFQKGNHHLGANIWTHTHMYREFSLFIFLDLGLEPQVQPGLPKSPEERPKDLEAGAADL